MPADGRQGNPPMSLSFQVAMARWAHSRMKAGRGLAALAVIGSLSAVAIAEDAWPNRDEDKPPSGPIAPLDRQENPSTDAAKHDQPKSKDKATAETTRPSL